MDKELAIKCAQKPEAQTELYLKLFVHAQEISQIFHEDESKGSYLKPKSYQIFMATDLA
jgi:hypothetical protein